VAWYHAFSRRRPLPTPLPLPTEEPKTLTASAAPVTSPRTELLRTPDTWQNEAWEYYQNLGEFRYAADWEANVLSRIRLYAAKIEPGTDEPVRANAGTAVDLMTNFAGGVGGQAQIMAGLATQLTVPGEGYLIVENVNGIEQWSVRSIDEVRAARGKYEVLDENSPRTGDQWRPLAPESMAPIRVWRPNKRFHHIADSPARAARSTMRELELVNRHITAQYLSRLASAGVVVFPDEITFPVREEFADAPDPFMAEWIENAKTAISTPGTAAAVVPMPIRVPGEYVDKIAHIDFTLRSDDKIIEKRDSAIKRLASQLNVPPEVLLGMGELNHWCTLDNVRIMTRAGWKTYDQLTVGEEVLTLNHDTGLSEWQPLLAVNTWDVVDEPMVTITGRRHTSTTTLNHRWPILSGLARKRGRDWTTTAELMQAAKAAGDDAQRHEYLVLAAPSADLPTEPKYQDALVELVAWYFTEGNRGVREGRNTPQVIIHQSHIVNPDNCARIRRALTALFGPASESLDKGGRYATPESVARRAEARRLRAENPKMPNVEIARRLGVSGAMVAKYLAKEAKLRDSAPRWRERVKRSGQLTIFILNSAAAEVILEHAPGRVVTPEFVQRLTAAQLELFIDTAVRGDGHVTAKDSSTFGQKDPAMCDAFELACILSGRSVNRYEVTGLGASANGPRLKTQHVVSSTNRSLTFAPRGRSFEEFTHTGTIWCPTTPNRSWLAEDNGHVFFTGNSAWIADETSLKVNTAPDAELVSQALTTGYLQPRLKASGVEDWATWVVWYDMSELTLRPDRSDDAVQLYDRLEINGAALRRETGFNEDDRPEGDELKEQALKVIIKTLPSGAGSALSQLVGERVEITPVAAQTPAAVAAQDDAPQAEERAAPATRDEPPPTDEAARQAAAEARAERMAQQAKALHAVRFAAGRPPDLLHPALCSSHAYSCPFTHAAAKLQTLPRPGTSGVYEARLSAFGQLTIGRLSPHLDTTGFLTTVSPRSSNGFAKR